MQSLLVRLFPLYLIVFLLPDLIGLPNGFFALIWQKVADRKEQSSFYWIPPLRFTLSYRVQKRVENQDSIFHLDLLGSNQVSIKFPSSDTPLADQYLVVLEAQKD